MDRGLNGINSGLSYIGVNATMPPDLIIQGRPPTQNDYKNFQLGTLWLDNKTNDPITAEDLYMLVSMEQGIAVWAQFGAGKLETLTGDTGGPVPPDVNDNINILGGDNITVDGNPGTSTLTIELDSDLLSTLTGNTGGAVGPDINNNIDIVSGIDGLTVDGNPGTNTLTINNSGGAPLLQTLTADTGGPVDPDNTGTIFVSGDHNIVTEGDPGTNTITVSVTNEITLGDLTPIPQGDDAITLETGDISLNAASGVVGAEGIAKIKFFPATIGEPTNDIHFFRNNVFMGIEAGNQTMTSTFNVGVGGNALMSLTTGARDTCVGQSAGEMLESGQQNSLYGYNAGKENVLGNENSAFGDSAWGIGTGSQNCAFGNAALSSLVDGNLNIAIGHEAAGLFVGSESNNTIIGHPGVAGVDSFVVIGSSDVTANDTNGAFLHNYPGIDASTANGGNIFVGFQSGNFTMTGTGNTAANIGIGNSALQSLTTGYANSCLGTFAASKITSGFGNVGIGAGVMWDEVSPGEPGLTTGSFNVAIGYNAGSGWTSNETSNIAISTEGLSGESLTTRIGGFVVGEPIQTKCFIQGIRGISTGINNAIAVLIDSAGQLGTVSSSERYKENITDIEETPLMDLRPVEFNYKGDDTIRYGLIAEEVADTFPYLAVFNENGDPETVKYHELPALLLHELQKMNERIKELETQVALLEEAADA